jgi:hypothetical protein
MVDKYWNQKEASEFLSGYNSQDTSMVKLNGNSTPVWSISPPSRRALRLDLESGGTLDLRIQWKISRHKDKSQTMDMDVYKNYEVNLGDETKLALASLLARIDNSTGENDASADDTVLIKEAFPNFLRVPEKGEAEVLGQLSKGSMFRNLTLRLKTDKNNSTLWFELYDTACNVSNPSQDPYNGFYRDSNDPSCHFLVTMLINEKVFPGALAVISGYG